MKAVERYVYVTNIGSGNIFVIDLTAHQLETDVEVGSMPTVVAVRP